MSVKFSLHLTWTGMAPRCMQKLNRTSKRCLHLPCLLHLHVRVSTISTPTPAPRAPTAWSGSQAGRQRITTTFGIHCLYPTFDATASSKTAGASLTSRSYHQLGKRPTIESSHLARMSEGTKENESATRAPGAAQCHLADFDERSCT